MYKPQVLAIYIQPTGEGLMFDSNHGQKTAPRENVPPGSQIVLLKNKNLDSCKQDKFICAMLVFKYMKWVKTI